MEQSDLGPHCLHAKFNQKHQVLLFWWELIICMLGIFFIFCCRLLTLFEISFFKNFFQEYYQSVKWFGSRSGLLLWVQIICKGYQRGNLKLHSL